MSMTAKDFGERLQDSFTWWMRTRDVPDDIVKKLAVQRRAINDLYALFSHVLEVLAQLEGLPPESLGRKLWLPNGLQVSGDVKKFG